MDIQIQKNFKYWHSSLSYQYAFIFIFIILLQSSVLAALAVILVIACFHLCRYADYILWASALDFRLMIMNMDISGPWTVEDQTHWSNHSWKCSCFWSLFRSWESNTLRQVLLNLSCRLRVSVACLVWGVKTCTLFA